MSVAAIIYLVGLLVFFIGGFIFFIVMDYKKDKTKKPKTKKKNKK